jgi:hypothetical protein
MVSKTQIETYAKKYAVKTSATIVFFVLLTFFSFRWGYFNDKSKSKKHRFLNGIKSVFIIFAIILILSAMMAILFHMNFWELIFFGGDFINIIGHITISLISLLTN